MMTWFRCFHVKILGRVLEFQGNDPPHIKTIYIVRIGQW